MNTLPRSKNINMRNICLFFQYSCLFHQANRVAKPAKFDEAARKRKLLPHVAVEAEEEAPKKKKRKLLKGPLEPSESHLVV